MRLRLLVGLSGALVAACHPGPPLPPPPPPPPPQPPAQGIPARDSTRPPAAPPRADPTLSAAERDSLVREAQARRVAWPARGILDYHIRITVGCFCPWPKTPAVMEVRHGTPVALRDTTGRSAGPVREPWSLYTVEGLFDAVELAAHRDDVVEVSYDASLGYPTRIRGDAKLGQFDDWFWVTADHLTPRR